MKNTIPSEESIKTFVDAGSTSLDHHTFVASELNEAKVKLNKALSVKVASEDDSSSDREMEVEFRINQTGNIFYSTTSPQLQEETKKLFESVTVLFAAMTKALAEKNKDLFDYGAWSAIIKKSGYFVEVQKFRRNITIEKKSLTIDTQIVQQLLPGLKSGSSMEIAKNVLSAINGEYKSERMTEKAKLGHLLFICEELFGAPSVTVRLFFATKDSHTKITSSPCHKTSSTEIEQLQEADTFLFVSPDAMLELAGKFDEMPEEYTRLIERLSGYIDTE